MQEKKGGCSQTTYIVVSSDDKFPVASFLGRSFFPHLASGRHRPHPSWWVLLVVNRPWTNYQMPFIARQFEGFPLIFLLKNCNRILSRIEYNRAKIHALVGFGTL